MGITTSDIITLAQNTKALSKEQLARILEVAPTMSAGELAQIKQMLLSLQEAELKDIKNEIAARENISIKYKEFKTNKDRSYREKAEQTDREIELQNITTLIK